MPPQKRETLITTMSELCPILAASVHSPELLGEFCGGLNNAIRLPLENLSKGLITELNLQHSEEEEDMVDRHEIRYFREAIMGAPSTALGVNNGLIDGYRYLLESFFDTYPSIERLLLDMIPPSGNCTECLKEANRQWCNRYPVDPDFAPHPCEKQTVPVVDAEDRVKLILTLNLKLHYPEEETWQPLLACRDQIVCQVEQLLREDAVSLDKLPADLKSVLFCLRSSICSLRPYISPYDIWDTLIGRLCNSIEKVEVFLEGVEQERKRRQSSGNVLSRVFGQLMRSRPKKPARNDSFEKVSQAQQLQAEKLKQTFLVLVAQVEEHEPRPDEEAYDTNQNQEELRAKEDEESP
eukprot:TRINITY_DN3611_c0_g2_i1.p1 TRINITY_DN3611_c0_g2~~TRINITY_DN3611_c0_g2_i1.p1  ORF type:complete len:352 (+),score=47.77 TRINITY_DN3611_c0_g2_i1:45-1100(+)